MNSDNLILGPGYLNWNSANFRFAEGGLRVKLIKNQREVSAEEFGRFDTVQTDRRYEISGRLWSGWENLSSLYPAAVLTPVIGTKLFGTTDVPATLNGQDGSRFVGHRMKVTSLASITPGVESELFAADVVFTGLLKSTATSPADANGYFTESTGQAYTAPAFVPGNFRAPVISGAWSGKTGFTAFNFRKPPQIDFKLALDYEPCYVDGYGTLDAILDGFEGSCKGMPIVPTLAQALTQQNFQGQALGVLQSTVAADLVISGASFSTTLYSAFIADGDGMAWARKNHRIGDLTWRTTVPFSAGLPTARMAVS